MGPPRYFPHARAVLLGMDPGRPLLRAFSNVPPNPAANVLVSLFEPLV